MAPSGLTNYCRRFLVFSLFDGFFLAVLRGESSSRDAKVVRPLDRKALMIRLINDSLTLV